MKMKSFLIPALALALAGCANEELETIGSGTIPAVPSGQTILSRYWRILLRFSLYVLLRSFAASRIRFCSA